MARASMWLIVGVLAACRGGEVSNCMFDVEGVRVCLPDMTSVSYCNAHFPNGEGEVADSSDDPTCKDLGFPHECNEPLNDKGGNSTATFLYYFTESEEDCTAVSGATVIENP